MKRLKSENFGKSYILPGFITLAFLAIGTLAYFIFQISAREGDLPEDEIANLGKVIEEGDREVIIGEFIGVARATLSDTGEQVAMNKFWFEKEIALDEPVFFYVEYVNDGYSKERKILLKRTGEGSYAIIAEFSKSFSGWKLESGEDVLAGKELVVYEKEGNIWKLSN